MNPRRQHLWISIFLILSILAQIGHAKRSEKTEKIGKLLEDCSHWLLCMGWLIAITPFVEPIVNLVDFFMDLFPGIIPEYVQFFIIH